MVVPLLVHKEELLLMIYQEVSSTVKYVVKYLLTAYTEMANKDCTWLREISGWPCLDVAQQNISVEEL